MTCGPVQYAWDPCRNRSPTKEPTAQGPCRSTTAGHPPPQKYGLGEEEFDHAIAESASHRETNGMRLLSIAGEWFVTKEHPVSEQAFMSHGHRYHTYPHNGGTDRKIKPKGQTCNPGRIFNRIAVGPPSAQWCLGAPNRNPRINITLRSCSPMSSAAADASAYDRNQHQTNEKHTR